MALRRRAYVLCNVCEDTSIVYYFEDILSTGVTGMPILAVTVKCGIA